MNGRGGNPCHQRTSPTNQPTKKHNTNEILLVQKRNTHAHARTQTNNANTSVGIIVPIVSWGTASFLVDRSIDFRRSSFAKKGL
mmetsp:Transcript_27111/g.56080  ORF Transcript_27111/g.56080 Transcript_27111/m.56080 type:complete len:84 (+) Transcript_27111:1217-1468(+)